MDFRQFLKESSNDKHLLAKIFPKEKIVDKDGTTCILLKDKPATVYADLTRHGWTPVSKVSKDGYFIGKHKDFHGVELKIGFYREGSTNKQISIVEN